MNNFGNEYISMIVYKARQTELVAQAENERIAKTIREDIFRPLRRATRINNNPIR